MTRNQLARLAEMQRAARAKRNSRLLAACGVLGALTITFAVLWLVKPSGDAACFDAANQAYDCARDTSSSALKCETVYSAQVCAALARPLTQVETRRYP